MLGPRKGRRTSVNAKRTPRPATEKTRNARCIVTKTIVTVSTRRVIHDSVRHRCEPSWLGQAPEPLGTRMGAEFFILPRGALVMRTGSMP